MQQTVLSRTTYATHFMVTRLLRLVWLFSSLMAGTVSPNIPWALFSDTWKLHHICFLKSRSRIPWMKGWCVVTADWVFGNQGVKSTYWRNLAFTLKQAKPDGVSTYHKECSENLVGNCTVTIKGPASGECKWNIRLHLISQYYEDHQIWFCTIFF